VSALDVAAARRGVLVVASAALHALALPPWDAWPLVWVALVPLFLALRGATVRGGCAIGFAWGVAAIWAIAYWVPPAIAAYYDQPLWAGLLLAMLSAIVVLGLPMAVYGAWAAAVLPRCSPTGRCLAAAAMWVAVELVRARAPFGNPWLLFGYALLPYPALSQAADVGGVFLLSFACVLANAAIAELVGALAAGGAARTAAWWPTASAAAVLAVAALHGRARLATADAPHGDPVAVSVVQANVDPSAHWRTEDYGRDLDRYLRLSGAASGHPRLLVWPESALTFFVDREPAYRSAIAETLRAALDGDLLTGGPHAVESAGRPASYFNSAFHLGPDGEVRARYDKERLLPFGEYFPWPSLDFLRRRFGHVREFTPGVETHPLETPAGKLGVAICFEAILPGVVRDRVREGAEVLVNLSNDAWLGAGAGPAQHFAMARLRAIEHHRWLVRAAPTGISAFVDPAGRIVRQTRPQAEAVLDGTVSPSRDTTFYGEHGDLFAWGCVAAAGAATLAALRRAQPPRVASE